MLHYVSHDPDAVEFGKAAIAYQIAKAESDSFLSQALLNQDAEKKCDATWAHTFLKIAMAGARSEDFETYFSKVTVIDFNYDRVLKQYLYSALQRLYGLAPVDAAQCLKQLNVIPPYGSSLRSNGREKNAVSPSETRTLIWRPPRAAFGHIPRKDRLGKRSK